VPPLLHSFPLPLAFTRAGVDRKAPPSAPHIHAPHSAKTAACSPATRTLDLAERDHCLVQLTLCPHHHSSSFVFLCSKSSTACARDTRPMVRRRSDLRFGGARRAFPSAPLLPTASAARKARTRTQDSPSGLRTAEPLEMIVGDDATSALCKLERSAGSRCAASSLLPPHPSPVSAPDSIPAADAGAVA
jgi:hypothetical protein